MSCGRNAAITCASVALENLSKGCCEVKRPDAGVCAG